VPSTNSHSLDKAALRGEPSYVWRAGQERRLKMIHDAAPNLDSAYVLENGCGIGVYVEKLRPLTRAVFGLDYDFERVAEGVERMRMDSVLICAASEHLPYPDNCFDLILSNEVIEHVHDDRAAVVEMVRVIKPGGRIALFCPNRWYPVETHGIYWRGEYHFGNKPFVNYLPDGLRNKLAPHVRAYTAHGLRRLFAGLPVRIITHTRIFGGYDNLIARFGALGKLIRRVLYRVEQTPLNVLGLSHFWVVEKI
jgi:SAM-dependent methyltransferase